MNYDEFSNGKMVIKNEGPCLSFFDKKISQVFEFFAMPTGSTGSIGQCKVIFANTYTYNIKISLIKADIKNHYWGTYINNV